jgi:hypothetical protein
MSNNIPKVSLEDSLYVLQLARETALAKNRQAQANRMNPVVEELRGLVANAYQSQPTTAPSTGVERNRLIGAMSEANMSDIDIARQFSMSRDEVQLILNAGQKTRNYGR